MSIFSLFSGFQAEISTSHSIEMKFHKSFNTWRTLFNVNQLAAFPKSFWNCLFNKHDVLSRRFMSDSSENEFTTWRWSACWVTSFLRRGWMNNSWENLKQGTRFDIHLKQFGTCRLVAWSCWNRFMDYHYDWRTVTGRNIKFPRLSLKSTSLTWPLTLLQTNHWFKAPLRGLKWR